MENSKFDIPLWESEGEAIEPIVPGQNGAEQFERVEPEKERLEPINLNRERAAGLGRVAAAPEREKATLGSVLREQRAKLREIRISDRALVKGAGAIAGAAAIGAFTAPAHPVIGAGLLAYGGMKAAGKMFDDFEAEYRRAQEKERARYHRDLEDYDKAFKKNQR